MDVCWGSKNKAYKYHRHFITEFLDVSRQGYVNGNWEDKFQQLIKFNTEMYAINWLEIKRVVNSISSSCIYSI